MIKLNGDYPLRIKKRLCPKCEHYMVIYDRPNNNKYNRSNKPFKCLTCDEVFTHKQVGAKINKQSCKIKDPERVKRISKMLMQHCAKLMSEKRRNKIN